MRPVNLVPKDYRRGALAGKGGETFSYVLVGVLGVLLIGVVAVVLTGNSVSDKKAEIAKLKQQQADEQARADALAPYASFATLEQSRTTTISSLAQSRFDWERVLRELSETIPAGINLTNLTGSVSPDAVVEGGTSDTSRASIPGPALDIAGCAPNQDAVGELIASLQDIDRVTRVGLGSSQSGGVAPSSGSTGATTPSGSAATGGACGKPGAVHFQIVAAFDAAPVPPADGATTLPAPTTPSTPVPNDGGVGEASQQRTNQRQDINQSQSKAEKATHLIPGN
jgi:Tfp pilus assembly protein PilN